MIYECTDCEWCIIFDSSDLRLCAERSLPALATRQYDNADASECPGFHEFPPYYSFAAEQADEALAYAENAPPETEVERRARLIREWAVKNSRRSKHDY